MHRSNAILFGVALALTASSAMAGGKGKAKGSKGGDEFPVVEPGGSCEAAIKSYVDEYDLKKKAPPDLSASDYGAVLNDGAYLGPCEVPSDMALDLCVAVQNGQAVGVTVKTTPPNDTVATCVAGQIRTLEFPSAPRMDVAKTHFDPEKKERETPAESDAPAPAAAKAPPPVPPSTGCGCGSSSSGGHAGIVAALALLALVPARRLGRSA